VKEIGTVICLRAGGKEGRRSFRIHGLFTGWIPPSHGLRGKKTKEKDKKIISMCLRCHGNRPCSGDESLPSKRRDQEKGTKGGESP